MAKLFLLFTFHHVFYIFYEKAEIGEKNENFVFLFL